jgi:hypothetical protein
MAICRGKSTFAAAKGPATTRILTRLNMAQLVILADFSAQILPGQLPRENGNSVEEAGHGAILAVK